MTAAPVRAGIYGRDITHDVSRLAEMSAQNIQRRILSLHQRQLASLVDDISRIEVVSCEGDGVEKVYLHEGADVTGAALPASKSDISEHARVRLPASPRPRYRRCRANAAAHLT